MVVFKSKIPEIEIPSIGILQYIFSNPNKISEDKVVFIDGITDKKLTFAELKSNSKRFAAGLQDKINFKNGDVLSIFSPNQVDYATIIFGTIAAGGKVFPASPTFTVDEFAFKLKDSGASVIVTHSICLSIAIRAAATANIPHSKIFLFGDKAIDGILPYSSLFGEHEAIPVEYTPEEIKTTTAFLCYSSGTTGKPKGIETTHLNMVSSVAQSLEIDSEIHPGMVFIGVLPFYHIYGLKAFMHLSLILGASCIILQQFELPTFCRVIQDYKVSMAHIVPPIILALVKSPITKEYDLSSLKEVISGGSPLRKELIESLYNIHKIKVRQGYGLTEASPAVTYTTNNIVPGSCGILIPNIDCKLISDDGQEVGYNEMGELCIRGPNIMKGYLNNKAATDAVMDKDGYYHTGDLATVDRDGNFYIVCRVKELIKYKGYQVVPAELEAVLLSHPSISDCAVIGTYSEQEATEYPVAYVVLQPNIQPTNKFTQEITNFVQDRVAPHKRLRGGIVYVDQIPKSLAGKILRRILKDMHSKM